MKILLLNLTVGAILFTPTVYGQDKVDTMLMVNMKPVDITAQRVWGNDTVRYHYNQMKYYVTTILPYLDEATRLFSEVNTKLEDEHISNRERRRFINAKEDELRVKFEDEIKDLNETQGTLLVKLIARQSGVNIYNMLKEFKNPFVAMKWQAWVKLNGFSIAKRYDPNDEPWLEHIMESLDYPLPSFYGDYDYLAGFSESVNKK